MKYWITIVCLIKNKKNVESIATKDTKFINDKTFWWPKSIFSIFILELYYFTLFEGKLFTLSSNRAFKKCLQDMSVEEIMNCKLISKFCHWKLVKRFVKDAENVKISNHSQVVYSIYCKVIMSESELKIHTFVVKI